MTNTTVSRLGQINGTGDVQALFLKIFSGEVLTEFERTTIFKALHFVRQIANGKSASFPLIGKATAAYHTPGNFLDAGTIGHAEQVITVDDLLTATTFIANIDEAMNHYDVRQPYSAELGRVLANTYDINVARMVALAARSSSPLAGRPGGSRITDAAMATDAAKLEAAMFSAAQIFDEKDVGLADAQAVFRPAQFYLLAQRDRLVNKELGGSGSVASGKVETVAGFPIVKSNHIPSTNVTSGPTKYQGDFRTTVGLIFNKMAVGTVQLLDLAMESEYEIRRQGTFFVAKYAVGHGKLREDCAIEVATGAVA